MTGILPHPVLASNTTNYGSECSFGMEITGEQLVGETINVHARFALKSRFLDGLVEAGQAGIFVLVGCNGTYARQTFRAAKATELLQLPLANYTNEINFKPFVVALRDIKTDMSDEHERLFSGFPFNVPVGSILAIGDPHVLKIDLLPHASAAIRLVTLDGLEDGEYVIETNHDYIEIHLNPRTRRDVDGMRRQQTGQNALYPSLYVPALAHAIMNLDEADEDKTWVRSLRKTLKDHNMNPDDSSQQYVMAQKLLGYPLKSIFGSGVDRDE